MKNKHFAIMIAINVFQWLTVIFVTVCHWTKPSPITLTNCLFCLLLASGGAFYLATQVKDRAEFEALVRKLKAEIHLVKQFSEKLRDQL